MESSLPTVLVRSRLGAEEVLASGPDLAGVISIRDPGSSPLTLPAHARALELAFEDVLRPSPDCEEPPTCDHVRRIVEFGDQLLGSSGLVLVHCEKGQSRSAATAIILFALWLGEGRELEAVKRGFAILERPWASPLLIDLADQVLEREGKLAAAFTQARSER